MMHTASAQVIGAVAADFSTASGLFQPPDVNDDDCDVSRPCGLAAGHCMHEVPLPSCMQKEQPPSVVSPSHDGHVLLLLGCAVVVWVVAGLVGQTPRRPACAWTGFGGRLTCWGAQ